MKLELTKTYRDKALKNIPHRKRLSDIYRIIDSMGLSHQVGLTYADFGCATGFVTDLVAKKLKPKSAYGFCHSKGIEVGKELYPHIQFGFIELTKPSHVGQYDLCTCFETLEHVGDVEIALDNLCRATRAGGTLLITVPVEVGMRGIAKFLAKTWFFKYNLDELPGERLYFKYLIALLANKDMSGFRDKRFGWGTHFGFDYRVIDRHLTIHGIRHRAWNKFTTRYYLISP